MATHVFRSASGQDLFSFKYGNLQPTCDKQIRYQMSYFGVVVLNDISGFCVNEDGVTVDETKPYTIKAGTHMPDFYVTYVLEKSRRAPKNIPGGKYLSMVVDNEDEMFEVRIQME